MGFSNSDFEASKWLGDNSTDITSNICANVGQRHSHCGHFDEAQPFWPRVC